MKITQRELLEHGSKILERILNKRLQKVVEINPMPRKSTVDAIFNVMLEKRIERRSIREAIENGHGGIPGL